MPQGVLTREGFGALVARLRDEGYRVIGPTVEENAIVLAELTSADQLPWGWGVETAAGRYRLRRRTDSAGFSHSAGPQSWKRFLHPPRDTLWRASRRENWAPRPPERTRERMAFIGVRPCDLKAIGILDTVLSGGAHRDDGYVARRLDLFVVVVECTEPGGTCFCASMGSGPGADQGFDLAMVELPDADDHRFTVRTGSARGEQILAGLAIRTLPDVDAQRARTEVEAAADRMGLAMPEADLRDLLADSRESPRWDDVASRCLTCGNCTLVCPTCFCTTTEEVTDLSGDNVERERRWDSCFDLQFSYIHGGPVRPSARSRYRQWMTHKLSTWFDQFGTSGCIGCGRCVSWCPVGIDITEEAHAFVGEQGVRERTEEEVAT